MKCLAKLFLLISVVLPQASHANSITWKCNKAKNTLETDENVIAVETSGYGTQAGAAFAAIKQAVEKNLLAQVKCPSCAPGKKGCESKISDVNYPFTIGIFNINKLKESITLIDDNGQETTNASDICTNSGGFFNPNWSCSAKGYWKNSSPHGKPSADGHCELCIDCDKQKVTSSYTALEEESSLLEAIITIIDDTIENYILGELS